MEGLPGPSLWCDPRKRGCGCAELDQNGIVSPSCVQVAEAERLHTAKAEQDFSEPGRGAIG